MPLLFRAASGSILGWAETKHFLPGIVSVMHTFGSKLNFNCHIHVLYTLGGLDPGTLDWRSNSFIPAEAIKSRFKTILLASLRQAFASGKVSVPRYVRNEWVKKFETDIFFNIQNKLWNSNWYLYIGEKLDNVDLTVKYIGRYAKRPSLAETRIIYYNQEENIVKFEYRDKITKENKIINISIDNFLGLLVRHIPEKHFHMIRYSGSYANARKSKIFPIIAKQLIAKFGIANLLFECVRGRVKTWRERIRELTGNDPLKCPNCQISMQLTQITYRIRDGTMKTVNFF